MSLYKNILTSILSLLLVGCARVVPTPQERLHVANDLALKNSLHVEIFKTKNFNIFGYKTNLSTCKHIHLYIEGDGLSWITSSTISDNPTPINPMGLKLMVKDNSTCKLYLARPCQYISSSKCNEKYWTNYRFSKEIIDSYNEILNGLKFESITIFGFSGGGTIAALLSASRDDIEKLVSIAGNLDIDFWAKKHYLTPLKGSLNPADFTDKLEDIEQIHLIGGKDTNIDKSIYDSYVSNFKNTKNIKYKIYKDFTHTCCWDKKWKEILLTLSIR